ncbi:hypothetical protein [Clostridiisalibacter paucivorans]|uniref:hypothetical protein n=1 Tax=Clostridiisalibacter paucivorans TaxID=408753 RepID=UPI00047D38BC|nr:hypothetical protein [Clostridiisalibacter paucivorans]
MAGTKTVTPFMELKKSVKERKAYFVKWYCSPKEDREPFEELSKKFLHNINYETAEQWVLEPKVAKAIKYYMRLLHLPKMKNIYDKMYEQALSGDVQSAKFLADFSKEFLADDKEDELSKILDGIDIND